MNLGRHQVTFEDETASFIESDDLPEPENGQEFQKKQYRNGRSRNIQRAEVEKAVVRNGGTTGIRKPVKIFMEAKSRNRTSQKPSASLYWKRNPVTDWPCTTWEGCWQTAGAGDRSCRCAGMVCQGTGGVSERGKAYRRKTASLPAVPHRQDVCRRSGNRTGL